ncbi:PD-(D/E)XK motif protein [Arthrobacter koreensis]|uniref:PD-(D/E)XK motif protein n=1 Tax=Arthrobacter koreensis TaxID=199136 RepID=UPI002DB6FD92|nr:PD-(D/E)XK motif protein [Arthrobacter koreensis]MEB7503962.1 PD-(D/E)XK motif protein [Arthrobacter koreensis]
MTYGSPEDNRRLDPQTINRYFSSSHTVVHLISQSPRCELHIEPSTEHMELHGQVDSSRPDLSQFENIEISFAADAAGEYFVLRIAANDMWYAAYNFIARIVEELQRGRLLADAISRGLTEYQLLLRSRNLLSAEKQVGLIGELLLLKYLCTIHPGRALSSWLGPEAEQHDFSFSEFDLEVKTTRSERRIHRIGSATQLEPSLNRPLLFLSVQVTSAGDSASALSLPALVDEIQTALGTNQGPFDDYMSNLGWRILDVESYQHKYMLRSRPNFYSVDRSFPALQDSTLRRLVPNYAHISDISYRTDVSHLNSVAVPEPLSGFPAYARTLSGGFDVSI